MDTSPAALDVDFAADGTGGVIVDAAEDMSPEEVLAFSTPEVGQHLAVQLFLGPDINP